MPAPTKVPVCLIIAGPNGAGKTTFAREFLPREGMLHFVNADLIAAGLSPLKPAMANLLAGRVFLSELDRLANSGADFAFESTLSGRAYVERINRWKARGYRVEIVYLCLASPEIALKRIAARVKEGGHNVPTADVRRRFIRIGETSRPCTVRFATLGGSTTPISAFPSSWTSIHEIFRPRRPHQSHQCRHASRRQGRRHASPGCRYQVVRHAQRKARSRVAIIFLRHAMPCRRPDLSFQAPEE